MRRELLHSTSYILLPENNPNVNLFRDSSTKFRNILKTKG